MTTYFDTKDKKDCCGCTACSSICPQEAIKMKPDFEGFLYPVVDKQLCINCGLCQTVCAFQDRSSDELKKPLVYAVKHKNELVRANSSSGGGFSAIAECILSLGGSIYGAIFDNNFKVVHERSVKSYTQFRGSKYVQSDMRDCYAMSKKDLEAGKKVLFTGTPCQIAGLKSYIPKKLQEGLITCDLVCHGVPSPKVWNDYLIFLEKENNQKINYVNFKDKSKMGWHNSTLTIKGVAAILSETQNTNAYFYLFSNNLILRPCCFHCKFANLYRPGDITLADFWGIEDFKPEFDDDKGISLVLINSLKGAQIWDLISEKLSVRNSNLRECVTKKQQNLSEPSKNFGGREQFWQDYKKSFEYALKMNTPYGKNSMASKVRHSCRILKQKIKKFFKLLTINN